MLWEEDTCSMCMSLLNKLATSRATADKGAAVRYLIRHEFPFRVGLHDALGEETTSRSGNAPARGTAR